MTWQNGPMKAVTFDFWNTLMWEKPGTMRALRRREIERAITELGLALDQEEIERELGVISDFQRDHWMRGELFQPHDGVRHLGESLADGRLTGGQRARIGEALLLSGADPELNPADGIGETLLELKERGMKLGIVCDVGIAPSTVLRGCLERAGLLHLFDTWAFSDEVSSYKPSPEIFRHVLDGLGVEARDAAHVGDLRRTDVAGSRDFGMTSIRYRGVADDPPDGVEDADHVISSHLEILEIGQFRASRS